MRIAQNTVRVDRVIIVRIKLINKLSMFSLASVLLQFVGYVYLIQLDDYRKPQETFLLFLAANAAVAYLSLILMAIGNLLSEGVFGRLQEAFWKICRISFFSLLGLVAVYAGLFLISILIHILIDIVQHPAK